MYTQQLVIPSFESRHLSAEAKTSKIGHISVSSANITVSQKQLSKNAMIVTE